MRLSQIHLLLKGSVPPDETTSRNLRSAPETNWAYPLAFRGANRIHATEAYYASTLRHRCCDSHPRRVRPEAVFLLRSERYSEHRRRHEREYEYL